MFVFPHAYRVLADAVIQIYGILSSLADSTGTLADGLEGLQSQRTTLEKLSSQLRSLEAEPYADQSLTVRTGTAKVQDSRPALSTLLEHLGCSQDNPTGANGQIERLVTTLTRKADANMAQVLKVSHETPEKTRAALRDIGAALSSNSSYSTEVEALQRSIDAARMDLERISI